MADHHRYHELLAEHFRPREVGEYERFPSLDPIFVRLANSWQRPLSNANRISCAPARCGCCADQAGSIRDQLLISCPLCSMTVCDRCVDFYACVWPQCCACNEEYGSYTHMHGSGLGN